jgi:hypothetical protein
VDHTVIVSFLYSLNTLFGEMNTKILLSGFAIIAALGLVVATTSAFAQNVTGGNVTGGNVTGGNVTGGNVTGGNVTGDNATTAADGDEDEDNGDDEEDEENEEDEGEGGGN